MINLKIIFTVLILTGFSGGDVIHLSVMEGGNLTIFTTNTRAEREPQILLSRTNGTSQDLIAQLFCHNNICTCYMSEPAVVISYDGQIVTVLFEKALRNQTGRYTIHSHSAEDMTYYITILESTSWGIIPESSYLFSKPVSVGIGATAGILLIAVLIGAIYYIKYRKMFQRVPDWVP